MITINKKYLDSALDIRKRYINNLKNINELEGEIQKHKDELLQIVENLNDVDDSENNSQNFNKIQQNTIIDIHKNINKLLEILKPFNEIISELENQSIVLYNNICEQYKNELTPDEIRQQVYEYVENNIN